MAALRPPSRHDRPPSAASRRRGLFAPLLVVAIVVLFPHIAPLPFYSYALVCAAAIHVELRRHGARFRDLGLERAGVTPSTIVIGIASGLAWSAFMKSVYIPIAKALAGGADTYDEYDFIRQHPLNLAVALVAAWLVGGLYEEMAFRGYVSRVVSDLLGGFRSGRILAGAVVSLLFGLYHWQQGAWGIVAATLGGFYWSGLVAWRGGSLWVAVLAHAVYDTTALILIYRGNF